MICSCQKSVKRDEPDVQRLIAHGIWCLEFWLVYWTSEVCDMNTNKYMGILLYIKHYWVSRESVQHSSRLHKLLRLGRREFWRFSGLSLFQVDYALLTATQKARILHRCRMIQSEYFQANKFHDAWEGECLCLEIRGMFSHVVTVQFALWICNQTFAPKCLRWGAGAAAAKVGSPNGGPIALFMLSTMLKLDSKNLDEFGEFQFEDPA